jgi:Protein of unknown function (DUF4238)
MSKEPKHHYIPIFYLEQWRQPNGPLTEYCRRYEGVVARPTYPGGTGYVRGLYMLHGVPADQAEVIETKLMSSVDNWAAKALGRMLQDGDSAGRLERHEALGWCQFLYSLIVRNPEHLVLIRQKLSELGPEILEEVRDRYDKLRRPGDPETFDQYKENFAKSPIVVPPARVLPNLIISKRVVRVIASMKWFTHSVHSAKYRLLTSDRPVIVTNGLIKPDAHIVIPMSPRRLFIAVKEEATLRQIASMSPDELVEIANNKVAEQAHTFVYGSDDSQLRFVANRLGKRVRSSPLG